MKQLIESITATEESFEPALASYGYFPKDPTKRFTLLLDLLALERVEAKELLCELHLYTSDGLPVVVSASSWPLSAQLKAPYQYLPEVAERGMIPLVSFESMDSFAAVVIRVRPWKRKFAHGELDVRRCFVTERIDLAGRPFIEYRELSPLEVPHD